MRKTEEKVISITLVMIMLLAMLIPSISFATTGEITIKDAKLKERILEVVDINDDGIVTEEEMKKMEVIDIPIGVTDITGLEYAKNLREIGIVYAKTMPDLSVLELETDLDIRVILEGGLDIDVKFDFLKNIQNLHHLTIIKSSSIAPNVKIDFKSLTEIKDLISLHLDGVAPSSIAEIKGIKGLMTLTILGDLEQPTIDLSGIGDFTELISLGFNTVNVKNANEIGKIAKLNSFVLGDVKGVSDLSALANCNQLLWVEICSTDLSDISFLENKEKIEYLRITDSPIKNINDRKVLLQLIPTLSNLQSLYIDVDGIKLESIEAYKEWEDFFTYKGDEEEGQNSNDNNTAKTPTEVKTETKKQVEKPTRIPQAGINVVGNAISILVAISVFLLAVAFVKLKRK